MTEHYLHHYAASISKSCRQAFGWQRLRKRAMRSYLRHYLGRGRTKLFFMELCLVLIRLKVFLTDGGK